MLNKKCLFLLMLSVLFSYSYSGYSETEHFKFSQANGVNFLSDQLYYDITGETIKINFKFGSDETFDTCMKECSELDSCEAFTFKEYSLKILFINLDYTICSLKKDIKVSSSSTLNDVNVRCGASGNSISEVEDELKLKLRLHIMDDVTFNIQGEKVRNYLTPFDVCQTLLPELNRIYSQAEILWVLDALMLEPIQKPLIPGTDKVDKRELRSMLSIIEDAVRDENGKADPARLEPLSQFMRTDQLSAKDELQSNIFNLYIFPFIGNTSQGNAMREYNFHTIAGSWTNKHNGGGIPEPFQMTEDWNDFDKGSLARTMAHELGHVLGLNHDECEEGCLMGGTISSGYSLTDDQIETARDIALRRMEEDCNEDHPTRSFLNICGFSDPVEDFYQEFYNQSF